MISAESAASLLCVTTITHLFLSLANFFNILIISPAVALSRLPVGSSASIIGTSKIQIIMQFIFELLFISIPSIISSLFLGNVLLKVIAGGIVNSEDSMISGGSLINDSFMLNITTLGQSYLILISIIVLSVVFASSLILIKKPKEILSKIS